MKHSDGSPYMSMTRFETGPNGNPHYHGFSVGTAGPEVKRVEADVGQVGDLPPQTVTEDVSVVCACFEKTGGDAAWVMTM